MTSTEQKNIVQPFIDHCFNYGILPTLYTKKFDCYALDTGRPPFSDLGDTRDFGQRLRDSLDPLEEARRLLPVLHRAPSVTRASPFIMGICDGSKVFVGNQAVMRFCEGFVTNRWSVFISETGATRHAKRHSRNIYGMLAPAGYNQVGRAIRNAGRLAYCKESHRLRNAADFIEYLVAGVRAGKHTTDIRRWCATNRSKSGLRIRYRKDSDAVADYRRVAFGIDDNDPPIPHWRQKFIRCTKSSGNDIRIYKYGDLTYVRLSTSKSGFGQSLKRGVPELYVFSRRDLDDLRYLITACALTKSYWRRRRYDIREVAKKKDFERLCGNFWSLYTHVMKECGENFELRNKLGVYFDVLQWRYLAKRSGDEFYDHSAIMGQKVVSKGLVKLPDQCHILGELYRTSMDVAVDMLGMYKASIYPEVDPFKVVTDQYHLHMNRFDTNWSEGSPEKLRFESTKSYMWYFGIRVLYKRYNIWPGKIRDGVETKDWHKDYKKNGVPGNRWYEAHDVDLTNAVPVAHISNEQYMRQQDSACAPPHHNEYRDFESMRIAPKRHRRKLLYAVQEPVLPDLPAALNHLSDIGRNLKDGHIDPIIHGLTFSTDIVTGSRCERHKDAPRPFYAASSPWGCILSYVDGITRDFLNNVPQSMLGKSTRQKNLDISSTSNYYKPGSQSFFMSDDKAKYSPHMDPNSQQLPADFFSEVFGLPGIKAIGPIMYHNELFYRVCGHLVHYNSNGTDREGMRGASNTWLEIVAQGLTTRLSREKDLTSGKSIFLSFIDDGLRKFCISKKDRSDDQVVEVARQVIDDVIFGLRVLGRELSWDKTFVSRDMLVILNELMYDNAHFSSGLKSFCTVGDVSLKEVMSAADYEQLYFGKLRGAHGVGTPLDLCHHTYIYETLMSHYKMGINLQDNSKVSNIDYRLFCMTPIAFGGGGIRSLMQLGCNEVASATREGMAALYRLAKHFTLLEYCIESILNQPLEIMDPVDFMREPEQVHVAGARIRSQRVTAEVRKHLHNIVANSLSIRYMNQDREGLELLKSLGTVMMRMPVISAEDVRLLYASTPVAFIDDFVQKLASSVTLSGLLGNRVLISLRRQVRRDLHSAIAAFRDRCGSAILIRAMSGDMALIAEMSPFMH